MTDTLVSPYEVALGDIQIKAASAALDGGLGVAQATDDAMEFWIIGGVTGLVDEVNDVVEPGAYRETLAKRRPKIIKDHDWTHRLGKVLDIFEAMPGDRRLPGTTARGESWPAKAGALLAKVRLFDTKEGRDAATRWREEGVEQEFSIGYSVPEGKSRKDRASGTRYIKALNLFEISDVLWGAMPLAGPLPGGLATKMLAGLDAEAVTGPLDEDLFDGDPVDGERSLFDDEDTDGAGDDLGGVDLDDPDLDAMDGGEPDDDPDLEVFADGLPDDDEDVETKRAFTAAERARAAADRVALADGSFPIKTAADLANAVRALGRASDKAKARRHIIKRARALGLVAKLPDDWGVKDAEPDDLERKYDVSPLGTPGGRQNWIEAQGGHLPAFVRAVAHALVRKGRPKSQAIAIAIATMKRWASGGGNVSPKTRAKAAKAVSEWEAMKARSHAKSASAALTRAQRSPLRAERDMLAKSYDPAREVGPDAGTVAPGDAPAPPGAVALGRTHVARDAALMPQDLVIESKAYGGCLPGSYEERREAVREAAWPLLRGALVDEDDAKRRYEWSEVDVVAMWDDRAVLTRYSWTDGPTTAETFEVPYAVIAGQAILGEPVEVRMVTSTVVEGVATEDVALPFATDIGQVSAGLKMLTAGQGKAGRVLSGSNESRLRAAVENLIGVLRAAGVDINPAAPAEPAGAPTGAQPVEAKTVPPVPLEPRAYLEGLGVFLREHAVTD